MLTKSETRMKLRSSCFLVTIASTPVLSFQHIVRRSFLSSPSKIHSAMTAQEERSGQTGEIWDGFASSYSKQPIADEDAYEQKLKVTQKYLTPDMNLLEFGSGTGGTAIRHSPFVKSILAIDISAKMVEISKQKAEEAKVTNVEFRQSSVDQLELPDSSQDMVLGLSVLHLLKNRDEAIAKTYRWLKPSGLFVTSTICIGDMGFGTKFFMKTVMPLGQFFGFVPNINLMTRDELKQSLTDGGFKIEHEWQPKKDAAVFIVGRKV